MEHEVRYINLRCALLTYIPFIKENNQNKTIVQNRIESGHTMFSLILI